MVFMVLITGSESFCQYKKTSVYLVAHQDDWQLFMGIDAYNDISDASHKVVFIYLTNGDACNKTGNCAFHIPYFIARENGAKNSVYLVTDHAGSPPAGKARPQNLHVSVNQHTITKWQYKNVVKYFLRLPDGHLDLDYPPRLRCGFNPEDSTYINNFRRGILRKLEDVTGLTMYYGWHDLVNTVRTIVKTEDTGTGVLLHTHEFSQALNTETHPDHRETGLIAENIRQRTPSVSVIYHLDYVTFSFSANLSDTETMKETGLFAAYNGAKINDGCPTDWKEADLRFCQRNYISRSFAAIEPGENMDMETGYIIEVHQNPSFHRTTVTLVVPYPDIVSCIVYNLRGEPVRQLARNLPMQYGKTSYVLHSLPRGMYILKVVTASGYCHHIKFHCGF
jgi:hypothetical protein